MSNMRVAVVGGGVSGLAAAYVVAKEGVEVVVYEEREMLGGRNNTVIVGDIALDVGFMVFTRVMHPEVIELLESVGVDMEMSDVSFSVTLDGGHGSQWGTKYGLSTLFLQKKNVFNPWFWKMITEIIKFKKDASIYLEELANNSDMDKNGTLRLFVESHGYSDLFQKAFLIPMCASIWSVSSELIMTFSAYFVLKILCNYDFLELLGLSGHRITSRWRSQSYVYKMKKELENRGCQIRTKSKVHSVLMNDWGCTITSEHGLQESFDGCIIAVHAPDALKILGQQATHDESRILGAFRYADSDMFVHGDTNLMPKIEAAWASTNFVGALNNKSCVTYWLNNLQKMGEGRDPFLLSVNPPNTPKNTLHKWSSRHPIPSVAAFKASTELHMIQGKRRLWFCGSYQGYGLPEDGVKGGILAGKGLLGNSCGVENVRRRMVVPTLLESGARSVVLRFFHQYIVTGDLILIEGGSIFTFEGSRKKRSLKVSLRIHTPQFYWKVATEGDLGFAEAYINGDISFVDKNEGLLNFIMLIIANNEVNAYSSNSKKKRGWWTPLLYTSLMASATYFIKSFSKKNKPSQTRQNISHHYDLSNELFSFFMDETMTYSSAIFKTEGEDLKDAQLRKLHILIQKARIKKEHHILEFGFGWGSFALEVVKMIGCKYTGITLSENQLQYVESKVKEAGLQDQIELFLCDYRELPHSCKYDRIISIEMLEHVGHEFMDEFFKASESALAENGLLVIQFSAMAEDKYDEARLSQGFMKEYIFPGGLAPSLNRVISAMAAASRLSVVHLEEIGHHYFETLKCWRQNLQKNHGQIIDMGFDEKFIRTWEYYFDYCAAAFKYSFAGNYQIVFSRPGDVAAFGNVPYNPVPSP